MTDWSTAFQQASPSLPGADWVPAWRAAALSSFTDVGVPRARAPGWRHTPLRALTSALPLVGQPAPVAVGGARAPDVPTVDGAVLLHLVDGVLADLATLPDGVTVTPIAAALRVAAPALQAQLDAAPASLNAPFDALNAAFVDGGAVIDVAPGVNAGVLHLVYTSAGAAPCARQTRVLVSVARGAQLTLVEHYVGAPGLHGAVTDLHVGANAEVTHVALQCQHPDTVHLSDVRVRQARDARYRGVSVALGAAWSRVGLHAVLDGPGADCRLSGVYLARDRQHCDHTVRVDHVAQNGTSDQVYRGILTGRARGVFSSLLYVGDAAQGADGSQNNRNLLLSPAAHVDSEPQLEIHTDDLKASHGTAIGELDAEALFYLRSRGVDTATARRMLTGAFVHDVVDRIAHDGVRGLISDAVDTWLAQAVS